MAKIFDVVAFANKLHEGGRKMEDEITQHY